MLVYSLTQLSLTELFLFIQTPKDYFLKFMDKN